jgi:hypothetical protein
MPNSNRPPAGSAERFDEVAEQAGQLREHKVREAAYRRYEQRRADGRGAGEAAAEQDWLEAEAEIDQQPRPRGVEPPA